MTPHSMILRGDSKKFEFISEIETKNETNLTHWPVAQAGANDEKNWGLKISLNCPFKVDSHRTERKIVHHTRPVGYSKIKLAYFGLY